MGQLGSAAADQSKKDLRNVGPSFQYRLRDAQGQAREFSNYMLPLLLDGAWYLLTGVRATPNESFRYMRLHAGRRWQRRQSYALARAAAG